MTKSETKGMTKKTLERLTDNQRDAFQTFQNYYKRTKSDDRAGAQFFKGKILGYAEALRDSGIITERERMAIVIYYTLD